MKKLGEDPRTGQEVTLRSGRFGPYLQLGETANGDGSKPKRASMPKGLSPDDIDLDHALALLSLPREVGKHQDGEPIMAGIGRFGPYIQHGKVFATLRSGDDVLTVGLNRAVTLIEEKRARGSRGPRFGRASGRELGQHPEKSGSILVKTGRYGPYVSHGTVNATLSSDMNPETVTLEQALELLRAKSVRGTSKKTESTLPTKPRSTARKAKPGQRSAAKPSSAARKDDKPARRAKAR
jgi:DNA topoisomerase-1